MTEKLRRQSNQPEDPVKRENLGKIGKALLWMGSGAAIVQAAYEVSRTPSIREANKQYIAAQRLVFETDEKMIRLAEEDNMDEVHFLNQHPRRKQALETIQAFRRFGLDSNLLMTQLLILGGSLLSVLAGKRLIEKTEASINSPAVSPEPAQQDEKPKQGMILWG